MRIHDVLLRSSLLLLVVVGISPAAAGTFDVSSRAELRETQNRVLAAQFLSRATFGPTKADIDSLSTRMGEIGRKAAFEEWIDAQFDTPASLHEPLVLQMISFDGLSPEQDSVNIFRYRHYAWWQNALAAPDQLRQRMAWALAQIFVIGDTGAGFFSRNAAPGDTVPHWVGMSDYYDKMVSNSFGNYRDLLEDVTYHPCMGVYLTYVRNRKANPAIGRFPDENYAREVMQLFSIGLNELTLDGRVRTHRRGDRRGQPIETYDNDDIRAFSRVFTGLVYGTENRFYSPRSFDTDMAMWEPEHDTEEKELLRGTVLPAGQTGDQDISDALDNLFLHPNCGPFIARRLIQRFVKSNPSRGYIRRVARKFNDNGQGVRGDFQAVIKAILLDGEAMNSLRRKKLLDETQLPNRVVNRLEISGRGTEFSKLREPVLRYTAFARAFDAQTDWPDGLFRLSSARGTMNQAPHQSPSVFNFYLPDHKPQGEIINYVGSRRLPDRQLYAPEFQIFTSVSANQMANLFRWDISDQKIDRTLINNSTLGRLDTDIALDISEEIALAETDPSGLLAHLDLLLCHGSMSDGVRQVIVDSITNDTNNFELRAELAILLTLTSPDCAVTE